MSRFTGSTGQIDISLNHDIADRPEDSIFINTTRAKPYGTEYVTVSPDTAREIIKALQEAVDKFEALPKPKPTKPTRLETIGGYDPGTVFTTGIYAPQKFVRLGGDDVFNVEAGRTVKIDDTFSNFFGTDDLKVVSA